MRRFLARCMSTVKEPKPQIQPVAAVDKGTQPKEDCKREEDDLTNKKKELGRTLKHEDDIRNLIG